MSRINNGGPAFPRPCADVDITDRMGQPRYNSPQEGMTLRDWFAGKALSGISQLSHSGPTELAEYCYKLADAMLEVRSK